MKNSGGRNGKITRRQLGIAITAAAALSAAAQTPQAPARAAEKETLAKSARDAIARNSQTLAKYEIPMATEPAFQFKA